jgi:hypothetical protein
METEKSEKVVKSFYCEKCDYKCCRKYDFNKHNLTRRHLTVTKGDVLLSEKSEKVVNKNLTCENCNKSYVSRNGIWLHKKKCIKKSTDEMLIQMVLDVVKSNSETQKQLVESITKNSGGSMNNSHNNSHNKTFNMQFFLNETCKDAMNIMDFVKDIKINLNDLEDVGKLGYVEGISNIIIKNLKGLEVNKRPVHCSDLKREVLYVKDEDHWSKEKEKMNYAIKHIAHKNIQMLPEWKQQNPAYSLNDGNKNDQFMQIVNQSMGGSDKKEEQVYQEKIITKVAKHVVVEKD